MKAAKKQATREKQIIISIIADLSSLAGLQEMFFMRVKRKRQARQSRRTGQRLEPRRKRSCQGISWSGLIRVEWTTESKPLSRLVKLISFLFLNAEIPRRTSESLTGKNAEWGLRGFSPLPGVQKQKSPDMWRNLNHHPIANPAPVRGKNNLLWTQANGHKRRPGFLPRIGLAPLSSHY